MIIPSQRRLLLAVAVAALALGSYAAWHYHQLGLTLSHYDARGHLIVARRVIDSITPGWQQLGAVWLPLPHLLNLLPVQIDAFYRTGFSGVALSIASFALAAAAVAWIVLALTESSWAAGASVAVFILNPNLLYLQSTPMTEPLLLACMLIAVAQLIAWCRAANASDGRPTPPTATVGWWLVAACLTRYEAWPVAGVAVPLAALARWRIGRSLLDAVVDVVPIALYPIATAIAFMTFSRVVVGEWFVSSGFFVPDPKYASSWGAATAIWEGAVGLSGLWTIRLALLGLALFIVRSLWQRERAHGMIAAALAATAALPWAAFSDGHPYRVRYMVPLVAIQAVSIGALVGMWKRLAPVLAIATMALVAFTPGPFNPEAPMVVEAQWDRPHAAGRQTVSACLARDWDGDTVMASMGSLGHYMQELAAHGFTLRNFLHEGNGDIWLNALYGPRPYVGWMLIEEEAEGGDMLAQLARTQPGFLDGFTRVCANAGVALYRRTPEPTMSSVSGLPSKSRSQSGKSAGDVRTSP